MTSELVDRVEGKRGDKIKRILNFCAVAFIVVALIKIVSGVSGGSYEKVGYWIDISYYLLLPLLYFLFKGKLKLNSGQFIE